MANEITCTHGMNLATLGNTIITPKNGIISWHLREDKISQDMDKFKIIVELTKAFAKWGEVFHPIKFESVPNINDAEICLGFYKNGDPDLPAAFGEKTLAYNFPPMAGYKHSSDMFINDGHNFSELHSDGAYRLFCVVVHELGHAFGLGHSQDMKDIMAPTYQPDGEVVFTQDTVSTLNKLYQKEKLKLSPVPTDVNLFLKNWLVDQPNLHSFSPGLLKRLGDMLGIKTSASNIMNIKNIATKIGLK